MRSFFDSSLHHLVLLGFCSAATLANNVIPTATIDSGVVMGKSTSLPVALGPVNQFLGIPFAKTPPERFSPPQAPPQFSHPINATEWKPACIQQFTSTPCDEIMLRRLLY